MSLNIQTANGLLEIGGGKMENILDDGSGNLSVQDKFGNVIAKIDEDGLTTTNINTNTLMLNGEDISQKIEDMVASSGGSSSDNGSSSTFSGDYYDLVNAPHIVDNGSDSFDIQDDNGCKIFTVDADGIATTNVTTHALTLNDTDMTTETWTFTLEDGSTVTKVVCVG